MLTVTKLGRRIASAWIWRDLSFTLRAGESLGLVAPSGGGKTLLLRSLAGLDPVDEGEFRLDDRPFEQWDVPRYRSQVAYLHQRPAFLEGSVEDNLRYPFRFACRKDVSYDEDALVDRLARFGKERDFMARPVEALSGGEAQIVAFLRATQFSPRMLLLDEPTSSLDKASARSIEAMIEEWKTADPQRGLIITSHDASQLERMTGRTVGLAEKNA